MCGVFDVENMYIWFSYYFYFNLLGENFAVRKPAIQSGTTHGGDASRAVDGNPSRNYFGDHSCTHTDEETTPWWRVDLQQRIAVTHVKIANRNSNGKRLCGFEIRIGDSLENNGITNPRCGTRQHIRTDQVRTLTNTYLPPSPNLFSLLLFIYWVIVF
jgi:predicted RNA-binding Zn-ribbon protein involved in translation (DUF1610 family)